MPQKVMRRSLIYRFSRQIETAARLCSLKFSGYAEYIDFHILNFTRPEGGGCIVIRRRPITRCNLICESL